MGTITVSAEGGVGAAAEQVYGYIADMREHHPRFLPPNFLEFELIEGGVGEGTRTRFKLKAGGRTREFRMRVSEPAPGRVLAENDEESSLVTTFTVTPEGATSRVTITTTWDGAGGIGGTFERLFAPRVMRSIYRDELQRLDAYARSGATGT